MKITLQPTTKIVELGSSDGGSTCRIMAHIWEGETESGIPVHAFIPLIAPTIPRDDPRLREFQETLQEMKAPSAGVESYPLRLIL